MKRTTPLLSIACTLALSMVLLIGCTDIFHPPQKVTAVAIDQARPLMVGETSQLTANHYSRRRDQQAGILDFQQSRYRHG